MIKKYAIALFMLAAVLLVPFASNDTQYYFSLGKSVHNGVNPYTESWNIENKFFYPASDSSTVGTMYGPLTLNIFNLFYSVSGDSVVNFVIIWKILMVGVLFLVGYLVWRLIGVIDKNSDKKIFYAFWLTQPLLLFEWVGNGHFDGLWLIFVLLAFIFAQKKLWCLVVLSLVIGAWIKFIPILFAPWFLFWWWQDIDRNNWLKRAGQAVVGVIMAGCVSVLAWWPFWQGPKVFQAIILQSKWAVHSLFAALYYSLKPLSVSIFDDKAHWFLTRFLHLALFVLVIYFLYPLLKEVGRLIIRKIQWQPIQYMSAAFISLLVYLLVWQKSFWPWYVYFIIPIGLIVYIKSQNIFLKKILLWLSLAPIFFYLPWMLSGGDTIRLSFFWYVFCLVSVFPLFQLWKWRKVGYQL